MNKEFYRQSFREFRIKDFLLNNKYTILCVIYFFVIVSFQINSIHLKNVLNIIAVLLIMNVLAKTKYTLILNILLVASLSLDAYFAFVYQELINPGIAASMMETNYREAVSMLQDAILPALAVISVTTFLYIKALREMKQNIIPRWVSLVFVSSFLFIVMPLHVRKRVLKYDQTESVEYKYVNNCLVYVHRYASPRVSLVFANWLSLSVYLSERLNTDKFGESIRHLPDGIEWMSTDSIPDKIFIVIGESSWRNHYSLYGYDRATTPFLDSITNIPKRLIFKEGVSVASVTCFAVPMALSFATASDRSLFITQQNVIDLAKNAGYETYWISAQEKMIVNQNDVSQLAAVADNIDYLEGLGVMDMDLLGYVDKYLDKENKQCFFIHTNGSHGPWTDKSTPEDVIAIPGSKPVDEYDRTLHYTDYFLSQVNRRAESAGNSVLFYFSDHGEVLGKGHGFMHAGIAQYEVPILAINYSHVPLEEIMDCYLNSDTTLVNTSNNIYILAEMMGYKVVEKVRSRARDEGKYLFHSDLQARTIAEVEALKR